MSDIAVTYQAIKGVVRATPYITWDEQFGSYDPKYPASQLVVFPMSNVCKSANLLSTSTRYKGTLDKPRSVRLMGVCRHNISVDGLIRHRVYDLPAVSFTVNTSTNIATTGVAHQLFTGDRVTVWSTGTLPTGMVYGTVYYARTVSPSSVTLHPTSNDASNNTSVLDVTTVGTGVHEMLCSLSFDSEWTDAWPAVYVDSPEWEDDNFWDQKYTQEEIKGYRATRPFVLDQVYLARMFTVEVDDPFNSEGKISIGMLDYSKGWQMSVGFDIGSDYGFRGRTKVMESDGGVKDFDRKDKPRTFNGNVQSMPYDEVMEQGFEDFRVNDLDGPALWVPHPDDPRHWLRNCFMSTNVELGKFKYVNSSKNSSVPIALEELL